MVYYEHEVKTVQNGINLRTPEMCRTGWLVALPPHTLLFPHRPAARLLEGMLLSPPILSGSIFVKPAISST
ncbi:hypothetical protein GCM10008938_41930 [Deinococcus roseus]|uniref:Uncharacterized protein n=1 Tax=Deinococcus roseus TaxID=392414 RepID=A0ABQ2DAL1_9DEIO|nr:hypothetical protein GCM10008938_41930 [Deinococcus roseus]